MEGIKVIYLGGIKNHHNRTPRYYFGESYKYSSINKPSGKILLEI